MKYLNLSYFIWQKNIKKSIK